MNNLPDSIIDWFVENVFSWLIVLMICVLIGALIFIPFWIYFDYKAEKFSLRKDEWVCMNAVESATTTYIQSGSVLVPMTTYSKHCIQWNEKQ